MYPSPGPASLNASHPSRSCRPRCGMSRSPSAGTCRPLGTMCPASAPEGTAMLGGSTAKHIASAGRLGGGPALGPEHAMDC